MPPVELGKHFTLAEMTASQVASRLGYDNTPSVEATTCLRGLVQHILDPLREKLGKPIIVSSGFRSARVNSAVGGASSSQHCLGQAADINVKGMPVADLVATIRQLNLPFDQLIDEFGDWVHVSYGPEQRRDVMKARKENGKTVYLRVR